MGEQKAGWGVGKPWRGTSTNSPIYLRRHHSLEIVAAADQLDLASLPLYYIYMYGKHFMPSPYASRRVYVQCITRLCIIVLRDIELDFLGTFLRNNPVERNPLVAQARRQQHSYAAGKRKERCSYFIVCSLLLSCIIIVVPRSPHPVPNAKHHPCIIYNLYTTSQIMVAF